MPAYKLTIPYIPVETSSSQISTRKSTKGMDTNEERRCTFVGDLTKRAKTLPALRVIVARYSSSCPADKDLGFGQQRFTTTTNFDVI